MDITATRKGGFAGVNERLGPVDTQVLPAEVGAEIESVVAGVGFFDLPSTFGPGSGADLFEFTLVVLDGGRCHATSWDDLSDRPPELDQLVDLLLQAGALWAPPVGGARSGNPLFFSWTHSREEDGDGVEVYRPDDFAFPPSFRRDGFRLHPDGRFVRRDIGPADGTVDVPGRWTAKVVDVAFDDPAVEASTLTIRSYDRDRLELAGAVAPEPVLPCGEWLAYLDLQPPGPPTLRVLGSCTFPTEGYEVRLARHEPPGTNPRDLLLDLTVVAPEGPVAQVVTTVEARFEEECAAGDLDTVTILPDGVTVEVQEVH